MHHIYQKFCGPGVEVKITRVFTNCRSGPQLEAWQVGRFITLHINHLRPMDTTLNQYKYILVVVDAFSKFVWLFSTKSTGAEEVIFKLSSSHLLISKTYHRCCFCRQRLQKFWPQIWLNVCGIPQGQPEGMLRLNRWNTQSYPYLQKSSRNSLGLCRRYNARYMHA